ncbi:dynein light chain Tctex-type protein 2B-like [Uloborus diversus]|uniref:dynein light chain Tctex-type protein 2B-like n=1 Tax=Uloborus diversus TaxID=327109 RepID=UPI0024093F13|nr:dynein light chain Tctex-type protein 2B-like [Uloborus diversus]
MSEEERQSDEFRTSEVDEKDEGTFYVTQMLPVDSGEDAGESKISDLVSPEDETTEEGDDDLYSYQIQPTAAIKRTVIEETATRILGKYLTDKEYSSLDPKHVAIRIAANIRENVRKMGYERYRIVCEVSIGEKCDQDVAMTFLCLWKHEFDHYVTVTFDGEDFFATALIFFIYQQ